MIQKPANIFLTNRAEILIVINRIRDKDRYAMRIAREINMSYGAVISVLEEIEDRGFIKKKNSGRIEYIILTKTGKELVNNLEKIKYNDKRN